MGQAPGPIILRKIWTRLTPAVPDARANEHERYLDWMINGLGATLPRRNEKDLSRIKVELFRGVPRIVERTEGGICLGDPFMRSHHLRGEGHRLN